ncbi:hypothetical protein T4D_2789 [Trichinella pseudospiralis]|uniref:Uncharacterized protein n=1 Tax=Trichinella pseudospiralis TaxID=6337 RepID=A0A0V1F961_TRIPS|nr:hypothetical protein T4D_2789 [Trichinella pseudospiralis]
MSEANLKIKINLHSDAISHINMHCVNKNRSPFTFSTLVYFHSISQARTWSATIPLFYIIYE